VASPYPRTDPTASTGTGTQAPTQEGTQAVTLAGTVTVVGISKLGRERIEQHGREWEPVKWLASVLVLGGRPGTLLRATDGYLRWLADDSDPDWKVERQEQEEQP
jgi:hypothetical protein